MSGVTLFRQGQSQPLLGFTKRQGQLEFSIGCIGKSGKLTYIETDQGAAETLLEVESEGVVFTVYNFTVNITSEPAHYFRLQDFPPDQ